ncbi:hypothetical protein JCGZ_13450 [Jatropha curcas]|uniref:PsbQ-like protein 3, chloroplastic n=1 Tax=Jatropha curcas TaxID=180498 RepID=A0A067KLQ2_JATCU|nr:psbQ-like protein 3, chloroplastic [Jatropha curcas]XP_012077825.1 psbQ-like protein 3, chloroplastic [Jatropha curcas]XP_012077826.1 psbQ-like protein 3, chloroplastic [Jatropha curcas]KDP33185.1 hypothetical protein JCGZ_13450 [Jatropha curcas]
MALRPSVSIQNLPTLLCCLKPTFHSKEIMSPQKLLQSNINRRIGAIVAVGSVILARKAILKPEIAFGLDMRMVAPDQTIEEAESVIRDHAQSLLDIKGLLESESWREAQKELRRSSSNLKLDIYTIIQSKPGSERPQLRKLYSDLFNNVTKLDYAARDKDGSRVWQYYGNIVVALDDILHRI